MEVTNSILEKYDLLQHQYLKDTGCDSLLLRHKKTGARVALLPCEDDNKVFYIGFRARLRRIPPALRISSSTLCCAAQGTSRSRTRSLSW